MKSINKIMFLLVLMILPVVCFAKGDFIKDYFNNKLDKPEVPYIKETQYENTDTQLRFFYTKTSELQNLALEIQKKGESELLSKYNINDLKVYIQVDSKFNDGKWLSESGTWDKINSDGNINYGDTIREWDLTFLSVDSACNDNANKLNYFTQTWLTYLDKDRNYNLFLDSYVGTKNYDNDDYYVFNDDVTITYRYRWVVSYLEDEYTDNSSYKIFVGPWSDITSIGKKSNQKEIKMPNVIKAPILSKFKLNIDDRGIGNINYFFMLDDSVYDAEKYKLINKDSFEPYIVEAEVMVNDGSWEEISISNATWLNNGYRVASVDNKDNLTSSDEVYLRVRIKDNETGETTEWSNIIGTNTEGLKHDHKCPLCGICPFQPLGICLFVWLLIIIIVLVILIIIVKKNKNNKKKN